QPETVRPEQPREVLGARLGRLVIALPEVQGDLARKACGEADQALPILLEHLAIDTRPAVKAFEEANGREFDEVPGAGAVSGEQLRNPVGAVEEGVLAVRVEVDERHTASGRYRRSRALSKPRRAGYFRPMRGLASLFALGLMMALFHRVTAGAALEARATLALGFLLLASFVAGDLASRARLPRITGYLLVGFAVGPAWLGLVRPDEVDALRFIGAVALGVIAFAAG